MNNKGQLTLVGIIFAIIAIAGFVIAVPIITSFIDLIYEDLSTTNKLIVSIFIPILGLGVLAGILYYISPTGYRQDQRVWG